MEKPIIVLSNSVETEDHPIINDVPLADQKENQESADADETKQTEESAADKYSNHLWADDEKWKSYLNDLYP